MTHIRTILAILALSVPAAPALAQEAETPSFTEEVVRTVSYRNGDAARRFQNYEAAMELYAEECAAGEGQSCKSLGDLHRRALGTNQDYDSAEGLYETACDLQFTEGCLELANMLFEGRGLTQDYPRARSLYAQACDLNDQIGCAVLGNMQYVGMGGLRDREEGADLLRGACAAEVDYACAQVSSFGIDRGNSRFFNPWTGGN